MPLKTASLDRESGFHSRLAQVVFIALLPALILSLSWGWREETAIHGARRDVAAQETDLAADRLNSWLSPAYFNAVALASILDDSSPSATSCSGVASSMLDFTVSIVADNRILCTRENAPTPVGMPSSDIATVRLSSVPDGVAANFWDGGLSVPLKNPGMMLIVNWAPHTLDALIGTGNSDIGRATITDASGRVIVERSRSARELPVLTISRPIGQTALFLTNAFPASEYGPRPDSWFWATEAAIVAITMAMSLASMRLIDRTVGSWVSYFRRVVVLLCRGRLSVRARISARAAIEIAELGAAINAMANNVGQRARSLELSIIERDELLRELQHRVKNNFQVIGHLIGLYKKTVPAARGAQLRFIEDHVHSMALVYRSAYRSDDNIHLSPIEIARSVITALCDNAGIPDIQIVVVASEDARISIDRATGLSLTLAYSLPSYLDAQRGRMTGNNPSLEPLHVYVGIINQLLLIEIDGLPTSGAERLTFQDRIATSYLSQLQARLTVPGTTAGLYRLEMPLADTFERPQTP